jgi:hypothetical protein
MKGHGALFSRRTRLVWLACLALAVPLLAVTTGQRPAAAANVVNVTIHVPAKVETNPCFLTDVINLSGDIHIVITTTNAGQGSYRVFTATNSQLSGVSITTGTNYVNSDVQGDLWYARPPFPAVHTHRWDFELVSQSNTPNYILHMTTEETVSASGVPTITVLRFHMDCVG